MHCCVSPTCDSDTKLLWLEGLASPADDMAICTFGCQPPQIVAHADGSDATSFFDRTISRPWVAVTDLVRIH